MRNRKDTIDHVQNFVLLLLSLSALILLFRLPLLSGSLGSQLQNLLTAAPVAGTQQQAQDLTDLIPSVHLVATGDSEYGRYSHLYLSTGSAAFLEVSPLLREAMGSSIEIGATADQTLQEALDTPSLYLDLTIPLPLDVVIAWLGGDTEEARMTYSQEVRAMALTTEEATAMLYLYGADGSIFRYETALPSSAVQETAASFAPNGGSFAFESNYSPLKPYTVLVSSLAPVPDVQSSLPDGYTAYNLLTALDFNAHTNSRYTEQGGAAEVVEGSPGTLRIGADGAVTYTGEPETASDLYQISSSGAAPTSLEILAAARQLAAALTEGTSASPLYLLGIQETAEGYTVSFHYQAGDLPVAFPDGEGALVLTVQEGTITAFTYRCRSYALTEQESTLLPPAMAIAIASLRPDTGLSLSYVDNGAETLSARWLAD